jgi:hypothetical protein
MNTEYIQTAVRVWAEPLDVDSRPRSRKGQKRWRHVLALDTETSIDAAQRLTFGSYRYFRATWTADVPTLTCAEEGIFYADELPYVDPQGFAALSRYTREHMADVTPGFATTIKLLPLQAFLKLFFKEAYKKRSLVVGFNLPFDLSRLAWDWSPSRGLFAGGHSLKFWRYERGGASRESGYRPRIVIKSIDSKRALKGFTGRRDPDEEDRVVDEDLGWEVDPNYRFRGHLLDLRTLAFALTDESYSLASACDAFGVEHAKTKAERHGEITESYIDYNRRDVLATAELFVKLMVEYLRHPIDLQATKAFSPASIGKAYLRAFGITPVLERQPDFPKDVLGYAMVAFYGGRSECRIRKVPMPVTYVDFLSMYPTVNALMGLWRFHIAERIEARDATDETRALLESADLEACFEQDLWKRLSVLVLVDPDDDILPVRGRYQEGRDGWQIGINIVQGDARWHALADVIASKLLTGRTPGVLRAVELHAQGHLPDLKTLRLPGGIAVDPARDDLFRVLIEERQRLASDPGMPEDERDRTRLFLKILANATAYGIFAELNRKEHRGRVRIFAENGEAFIRSISRIEEPGEFCFPPIPALIAAGARLMLAMLERSVADRGGVYVFCDTDSMAVVSGARQRRVECPGGSLRLESGAAAVSALAWSELDEIVARFALVNPYDRSVVPGSILKIEEENFDVEGARVELWSYAISAKRYALFER